MNEELRKMVYTRLMDCHRDLLESLAHLRLEDLSILFLDETGISAHDYDTCLREFIKQNISLHLVE